MAEICFIGDRLSALGYRLAGATVVETDEAGLAEAFERAMSEAALVIVTAEYAARLPPRRLAAALRAPSPLLSIVPDVQDRVAIPDLAARVRSALGVGS